MAMPAAHIPESASHDATEVAQPQIAQPELRLVRPSPAPFSATVLCTMDAEIVAALVQATGLQARIAGDELQLASQLDVSPARAVIVDASSVQLNPHRLARLARAHPTAPAVWLMVGRRDAQSSLLAQALGVDLLSKRVRAILAAIDPSTARRAHIEALSSLLDAIAAAFVSQAGPLGRHGVQAVREDMDSGHIPPTAEAFAQALVHRLRLPGPREGFVTQVRAVLEAHRAGHGQH